jgi:hypothetical protein
VNVNRSRDDLSWQRAGLGAGGRYTGRDYYGRRLTDPIAELPKPPMPGATARAVKVIGLVVALAGVAGWLWLVLAFVSSVGSGVFPDDLFGARLLGIPLGSGGLVAILVGSLLAAAGSWAAKSASQRVHWEPNRTDANRRV